jgi:hypothetical protein
MELEQNKAALKKAILALPSYQPPEGLWGDIEKQLDDASALDAAIEKLPDYHPPAQVWENIRQELEEPAPKPRLRIMSSLFLPRAAAVALIIIAAGLGLLLFDRDEAVNVNYAETTVIEKQIQVDYQEDEPMIQMVSQAFEESPVARQQDNYDRLRAELEELDQAKQDILDMMDAYGEDPQMIKQLADIERSRTDVVMKMARFI